jgi:beta-barrel assembly-enhancing protease
MSYRFITLVTLIAALSAGVSAKDKKDPKNDPDAIGNRSVGQGVNFYSVEKEIALGKQLAQEVERQAKVVDDSVIAEYVNRIGQNLVRNSDAKVPFTIKVLDTEDVNAFALPGGFFFINTGLILKAESEAELAGVMGHEIAHVAARHGTRAATRGQIMQIGLIAASIAMPYGWTGYAIMQGAGMAIPLGFLTFSRANEREADRLGLQYMYKSGYDPASFVDFFKKIESLERKKPGSVAKVFSTHPMTDDRIKAAQEEIEKDLPARPEYVVNTSEFNDVKARIAMLHGKRNLDTDPTGPTLRRPRGNDTDPVDANNDAGKPKPDQDGRPTLKRRDGDNN